MKYLVRLLAPAVVSIAVISPLVLPMARAAGNEASSKSSESSYRATYSHLGAALLATVYDRHDYAAAIDQLKALGRDDDAAVATLLGYSYRKLGDYKLAQIWYERALKADPNHVKAWQYYGMWQIEQGNREQAQYHLTRIAELAGPDSVEYQSLSAALEQQTAASLVY
jgi:Flp pilus assembly protein TadD